jgi:hypothetical protein
MPISKSIHNSCIVILRAALFREAHSPKHPPSSYQSFRYRATFPGFMLMAWGALSWRLCGISRQTTRVAKQSRILSVPRKELFNNIFIFEISYLGLCLTKTKLYRTKKIKSTSVFGVLNEGHSQQLRSEVAWSLYWPEDEFDSSNVLMFFSQTQTTAAYCGILPTLDHNVCEYFVNYV